jgi:hypothetical protein
MTSLPDDLVMPKKLKSRWLKALRGGRYKQTSGELRNAHGYCCLGVLCTVIDPRSWVRDDIGYSYRQKRHSNGELLPAHVMKLTGIDAVTQLKLANKNDGAPNRKRQTFKQIAAWIEENL